MAADLEEKTNRYGELLAEALEAATIAPPEGTPDGGSGRRLLRDGVVVSRGRDPLSRAGRSRQCAGVVFLRPRVARVGACIGLFDVPTEGHLFTVE